MSLLRRVLGVGAVLTLVLSVPLVVIPRAIVEGMRCRGVLIGMTGPAGDVLKIRPPLVFEDPHVGQLLAALEDTLQHLDPAPKHQREGQP
jgi:4-aminobutyrate aminotransferase-like enzyme